MIHWAGMDILDQFSELVDPKHTVLLLWNFSPEAIGRCFNGTSVLANTRLLVTAARRRGVRLMYSKPGPLDSQTVGAPMIRMWMKQLRIASPSAAASQSTQTAGEHPFAEGLEPGKEDIIIEKFLPNAFLGTSFEWWLRKHRVKTILLTGAALETGIDGTARDALNLGYYTVIVRDCVGSPFQDTYEAALLSLKRIFDIATSSDIIVEWQRA